MIKTDNLGYRVGHKDLLKDISLELERGETTAILGPNGAGKSTLLKCLTGALTPTAGSVFLDHLNLRSYGLNSLANRRAVLSQSVQITFPFKVHEIVAMGRAPRQSDHMQDRQIVNEALDRVGAWHLKDRIISSLSGGEQQRVQFARVLTQVWGEEGAYLFLDEPTSALDLKHQFELFEIVNELTGKLNFGVVAVLHDLRMAMHYADRIIMLKNGQMVSNGQAKNTVSVDLVSQVYDLETRYAEMQFS